MRFSRVCAFGSGAPLASQRGRGAARSRAARSRRRSGGRAQLELDYTLKEAGNCVEAIPHLTESMRLDPRAITLINLADCEEKTGKLADAFVHWGDARSRAAAEGQKPIEEESMSRTAALDQKVPRLTIMRAKTDGVALGGPSVGVALSLDPGVHTIVVKARGHADASKQVTLKEGVGAVGLLSGGKKTESKVDAAIGPTSLLLRGGF